MEKKNDKKKKGFTLAELLIVVAIIAVLVAVAIPVFTAQLNKSKLATATANARAQYAKMVASNLGNAQTVSVNVMELQDYIYSTVKNPQDIRVYANGRTIVVAMGDISNEFTVDEGVVLTNGGTSGGMSGGGSGSRSW